MDPVLEQLWSQMVELICKDQGDKAFAVFEEAIRYTKQMSK